MVKKVTEAEEIQETIENEFKERKQIPDEVKKERDKNVFRNLMFAIGIMAYFILLNIGYYSIEKTLYTRDTVVFAFVTLIATIILFERSYRTEKGFFAIHGLEILVASIFTYFVPYLYFTFSDNITKAIMVSPLLFGIYYCFKSIGICVKAKQIKENDIKDIIKKEERVDNDNWTQMDKDMEVEEEKLETKVENEIKKPAKKGQTTKSKTKKTTSTNAKSKTQTKKTASSKTIKTTSTRKATTKKTATKTANQTKKPVSKKTTKKEVEE